MMVDADIEMNKFLTIRLIASLLQAIYYSARSRQIMVALDGPLSNTRGQMAMVSAL